MPALDPVATLDELLIEDPYGLAKRLGKALDIPSMALKRRLRDKQRRFIWIKRQLTEKQRDMVKSWEVPGLAFVEEPKRVYPNGSLLAQVLGFVGAEGGGLEGLELQYNKDLTGQLKTIILPRDARGRPLITVVEGERGALAGELFGDRRAHELTHVGDEGDFPRELHDPVVFMRPHSLSGISRPRKTVLR